MAAMIDTLINSWKELKNILRDKQNKFSFKNLITQLRIEEEDMKDNQEESKMGNLRRIHIR